MKKSFCIHKLTWVLVLVLILSSCSAEESEPEPVKPEPEPEEGIDWEETADLMQASTYKIYADPEGTMIKDNFGDNSFHYWPNAHVLHVMVDAYVRTEDPVYVERMKALVRGIKVKNGNTYSNVFNDDMLWLGNSTVRAYQATGDTEYLEAAEWLWDDILLSWSDDVFGGGITWKKDTPYEKNAVSNGPAAILGVRLYQATQDPEYLEWAKRIYKWEKDHLLDPHTSLIWDGMKIQNGQTYVNKDWIFTYNAGTFIGAGVWLYQATGEPQYLMDAVKTARSAINSSQLTTQGILRDEGQGDGGLFKGVLVRYLTELLRVESLDAGVIEDLAGFMEWNAKTLYEDGMSRPNMLVGPDWSNLPGTRTDLTTQLSGLMLIEAAALLDAEGYFDE